MYLHFVAFNAGRRLLSKTDSLLTLVIEDNILSSVALMRSTLTALSAFTPVMISLRLGSVAKRFLSAKVERITSVSFMPRFCLAFVMSLF